MLKNIWTHRLILLLDAALFSLIIYLRTGFLYEGMVLAVLLILAGMWKLNHPSILERHLLVDKEGAAVIRSVVLTLIFFVECIIATRWIII